MGVENDHAMIKQEYKKIVFDIVKKHVPACTVYLYGSRARGNHREGSDIDLALDAGSEISWERIAAIKEDFEESLLPLFVDVVDVHSADKEFLEEIKKDWVVIS